MSAVSQPAVVGRPALAGPVEQALVSATQNAFWISLRFFNFYRIGVAAIFLGSALLLDEGLRPGNEDRVLFASVAAGYLLLALGFHYGLKRHPRNFDLQLSLHVASDIVAVTIMMYASGGFHTGLGGMLLISLAAAALVSRGKLMLFYAALASIAILLEQGLQVLWHDQGVGGFVQPGLLSMAYFATAFITNQLAQRVLTHERIARQRGIDLANQLRVNQRVIQDVQDGVLVVDANGLVRQHNPQVEALLGRPAPELEQIDAFSPELARALGIWRERGAPSVATFSMPETGKVVLARFVEAGIESDRFTVVYLDDPSKLEEQSRQLKLAALGRLTANIAHEIRNPLAAITHAADLMAEENRQPTRKRLTRIIRDNALRLDRLVKDVLELNRRDRVQVEQIRMGGFLSTFLDEFAQNESVERGTFLLEVERDGEVEFDRVHLNQVLWNLTRNAWRHSSQGRNSVRLRLVRHGARLELHVMDDGPGVAKPLQAQLFEPFFTTYSAGTGLGLYIARELCAANRATLDYVDRPGRGADFRIAWQGLRG
jgi:two-component system sensor histidine kinase PilS (NtrC family)